MPTLPILTGHNLIGHQYTLPLHLEGELNLLFLINADVETAVIDSWRALLQRLGQQNHNLRYHELPVDLGEDALQEWTVAGTQRAGIYNQRAVNTTITVSVANPSLPASLDPNHHDGLVITLVTKEGNIIWQGASRLDDRQQDALTRILSPAPRQQGVEYDHIFTQTDLLSGSLRL